MEKIICANCRAFVPREKTRAIKGFHICLTCLEYNNINFEALQEQDKYFSDVQENNEAFLKCAI